MQRQVGQAPRNRDRRGGDTPEKKPIGGALGKLSVAWSYGVFLGIKGRSNEFIVSDSSGVYKARTIQRRSIGDRWDIASSDQVRHVPWEVSEDDERADGEGQVATKLTDEEIAEQVKEREFDLSDTAEQINQEHTN